MCGVEDGEPISSSGLAMKTRRSNGPGVRRQRRGARRSPGGPRAGRPSCPRRPAPCAMPSSIRNGRCGDRPIREDRVHVPDRAGARGPAPGAPSNVPTTVSPNRPFGSGRRSTRAPIRSRSAATQVADLVDARRRVAAAVDAAQPLEVGEERRQAGLDGRVDRGQLGVGDARARRRSSVVTRESLGSRAVEPLLSSPGRAPHRDPPPGRSEPLPARAGDQGRGRRSAGGAAGTAGASPSGTPWCAWRATVPRSGQPARVAAARRVDPAPSPRASRRRGRSAWPSIDRPTPATG